MGISRPHKVTIIAPTCFYYQVPLFREIASSKEINSTIYFCSEEGITGSDVRAAFHSSGNWGVQEGLLEGYPSKILTNHAFRGSYLKSLIGLANFGIWRELSKERPDTVIVMSWMNPTWWLTFLACLKFRIPMLFMTDANGEAEQFKSGWKLWIKHNALGKFLFRTSSGFLCAGTANERFYTKYDVPVNKMYPFAYSWGYNILMEQADRLKDRKSELRKKYGIPQDDTVLLYCGRLSPEKGSIDLLEAYKMVPLQGKALVLVGDGQLRKTLQDIVDTQGLESVYSMGFQNRNDIGEFYALADIFILPSHSETWGIVVAEALCFSLPVIVSDQVGAGFDLVSLNENGQIFPAGDVIALADRISRLIELPKEDRLKMGQKSRSLIKEWASKDLSLMLSNHISTIKLRSDVMPMSPAITCYRILPEWFARNLAFFFVGTALALGFLFLSFRPAIRQIKYTFKRLRR